MSKNEVTESLETPDAELNVDSMSDADVDAEFDRMSKEEPDYKQDEPVKDEPEPEEKEEPEPVETKQEEKPKEDQVEANKNAALQEARKENRLLQKQLQELAEKNDKLVKTFETAFQQKTPEPQVPSFEEDPIAHLKYKNEQLEKQLTEFSEYKNMTLQERKDYSEHQQFVNVYTSQLNDYAKSNPDFDPAYDYVMHSRLNEYKLMGMTHEDAVAEVRNEEKLVATRAMQDGVNPAERILALAKLRGFTGSGKVNGQTSPVANGHAEGRTDATARIDQIKRGQQASRTLNNGGANPGNKLTLADMANLPESEFEKLDWENDVLIHG